MLFLNLVFWEMKTRWPGCLQSLAMQQHLEISSREGRGLQLLIVFTLCSVFWFVAEQPASDCDVTSSSEFTPLLFRSFRKWGHRSAFCTAAVVLTEAAADVIVMWYAVKCWAIVSLGHYIFKVVCCMCKQVYFSISKQFLSCGKLHQEPCAKAGRLSSTNVKSVVCC